MPMLRRILLLAAVSTCGVALLAPLAAASTTADLVAIADALLPAAGDAPQMRPAERSETSQREGSAAAQGVPEALHQRALPTPAAVPMEATLISVASAPAPPRLQRVAASGGDGVWDDLARCESGGNWAINTGNGYYGGLQFSLGTWEQYGGTEFAAYPHQATRGEQINVAERLRTARGYAPWPACRAKLGLP